MYDIPAFIQDKDLFEEFKGCLSGSLPTTRVREAKIKLTARCNLRCAFCCFWRMKHQPELTTEEVRQVIDDLAELDCRKIHFSGGESTLREDLPEIVRHATDKGIRTSLTTNCTLMTPTLAEELLRAGLRGFSVSLDGTSHESHDALRGVKGAFKRTIAGLKNIRRARKQLKTKTKIRINMVLTRHNYQMYPDLLALAGELGAVEVTPIPVDEGKSRRNRLLPWQLQEFNEVVAPAAQAVRAKYGFSTSADMVYPFGRGKDDLQHSAEIEYARGYFSDRLCYAPWLYTMVIWNGDVYPCCMSRGKIPPMGNVREQSLKEIYLGPQYDALRTEFLDKRYPICARCDNYLVENRLIESGL